MSHDQSSNKPKNQTKFKEEKQEDSKNRVADEITDKQVQDRLIYKDTTLKAIISRYCEMLNSDNMGDHVEDIQKDIILYEFQIAKAQRTVQTLLHDRKNLEQLQENVHKKIKISSEEIESLKQEYQIQEQIKNNKMLYETVSSQIIQYDDQITVQQKIDKIISEINELNISHQGKMKLIKQKEKQLSLLLYTLRQLTDEEEQDTYL